MYTRELYDVCSTPFLWNYYAWSKDNIPFAPEFLDRDSLYPTATISLGQNKSGWFAMLRGKVVFQGMLANQQMPFCGLPPEYTPIEAPVGGGLQFGLAPGPSPIGQPVTSAGFIFPPNPPPTPPPIPWTFWGDYYGYCGGQLISEPEVFGDPGYHQVYGWTCLARNGTADNPQGAFLQWSTHFSSLGYDEPVNLGTRNLLIMPLSSVQRFSEIGLIWKVPGPAGGIIAGEVAGRGKTAHRRKVAGRQTPEITVGAVPVDT